MPLAALNSFVLFRRKKLNLSEHTIIAGMILLGILLLSLLGTLLFYPNLFAPYSDGLSDAIRIFIISTIFIFIGYGYVNAFGSDYGFFGLSYRLLLFYLLIFFEIFLLFLVTFGILTDWKFGEVVISVFD